MKNDAFAVFLAVGSLFILLLSYVIFAAFAESVKTVHKRLNESDEKNKKEKYDKAA